MTDSEIRQTIRAAITQESKIIIEAHLELLMDVKNQQKQTNLILNAIYELLKNRE